MQRKFLTSLSLIVVLNLLVKPLYIFGIDAQVQNTVGQELYGTYFFLLNVSYLFNLLSDFGINNYQNRSVSQNEKAFQGHFDKLLVVKGFLSLVYAIITLLIGLFLNLSEFEFKLLLLLIFNQVLVSFIQFARSNLAGLHEFKRDSIISVLDRVILILCCGFLLYGSWFDLPFQIAWFVYLQSAAYAITLMVAFVMLTKHIHKLRLRFDWQYAKYIMRRSAPFALFMLSAALYNRVDGVMLRELHDEGVLQVGYYAQGFRFYDAASMFAFLFASLLLPIYSKLLAKRQDVKPILGMASRLLTGIGLLGAIFVLFEGEWLLALFFDEVSTDSILAFQALMLAFVGMCWFYIYGTLLTANADLKLLNIIALTGLGVNIVMNVLLIPRFGAFGAALATMVTQLFCGLYQMVVVVKKFRFGWNWKMIRQFVLLAVVYFSLLYGLNLLPIPAIWQALIAFCLAPIWLVVSGFLDIAVLRDALKSG